MPSNYYPGLEQLESGALINLEGEEFHHLARVTRRRMNEPVLLNSGAGVMALAEVLEVGKRSARLTIVEIKRIPPPERPYAIAMALLRNKRDEQVVEKCTELGASAFFPFMSEHSVRQASDNTRQRLEKIALAAIKQCDNPWLPEVMEPLPLESALEAIIGRGYSPVVCSEIGGGTWLHHLEENLLRKPCFLIGPEGGWGEREFKLFGKYPQISLGRIITRADTAAISIAAQWLAHSERMGSSYKFIGS